MSTSIQGNRCCPITLGDVCWDNGVDTGRAFAIYDPVLLTTSFIDQATGDPVPAANVVPCDSGAITDGVATLGHIVATGAGTVTAGKQSVTFTNVGTTAGQVLGQDIAAGETITFTAYVDLVTNQHKRLPVIAYTANATAILSISWMD